MLNEIKKNRLEIEPVEKLLYKLAFPAIVANLVNALYNIVDQIFIGQGVGYLGNAATTIAFPFVSLCLAIGLMFGIGSAANLNLELGKKNYEKAKKIVGNAIILLTIIGLCICLFILIFLNKLLFLFGVTDQILNYAIKYTGITSLGIPFLLLSIGLNPLVRADGSPKYSMYTIIIGAILNTILDPILMFVFNMGISGAAWATVISQTVSALLLINYFKKFKSIKLEKKDFIPEFKIIKNIISLGLAAFILQFSTMLVYISTNNMLRIYGNNTKYGSDIPIAAAGVVLKVNVIYIAIIIGLVQGAQPIISFNYGAKNYKRVREITKVLIKSALTTSTIMFLIFELFPSHLISLFGTGNELYYEFAIKFMRICLCMTLLSGIITVSLNFFPAIGKAKKGSFISLTKQFILLLPLTLIMPRIFGLNGTMLALPISDFIASILAITMLKNEFKIMPRE